MPEYTTLGVTKKTKERLRELIKLEELQPGETRRTLSGEITMLVEYRIAKLRGEKDVQEK